MNFRNLDQTWIIAEIGVNHEGDFDRAVDMIEKAAKAGANAVKFQTFRIEHYVSRIQPERFNRTSGFQLETEQFRALAEVAKKNGVTFFSTPLCEETLNVVADLAPLIKISSGDLTHLELIRAAARKKKPLIVSTGLGSLEEIQAAVDAVVSEWPEAANNGQFALMHCVASYPTPAEDANLRNIKWLQDHFDLPIGYSDHTMGTEACAIAVSMGACVIEKHFTYSRENQTFHDHHISADPEDLAALTKRIREIEIYLGQYDRDNSSSANAEQMLVHMRRSIGTLVDIPAGTEIQRQWLTWVRPAQGMGPDQMTNVVGKTAARDIPKGYPVFPEDIGL